MVIQIHHFRLFNRKKAAKKSKNFLYCVHSNIFLRFLLNLIPWEYKKQQKASLTIQNNSFVIIMLPQIRPLRKSKKEMS